jgi:hypothetical protein
MRRFLQNTMMTGMLSLLAIWLTACGALVTSPSPPINATGSTAITRPYPTTGPTQTIYSNALTQQAAGWAKSPTCVFTSNGLVVRPDGGQAYLCLAPTTPLGDLAVGVTVQQKSGANNQAFGIAFHHITPKNYYFFGIDGRGHFTATVVVNDVRHIVIPFTSNTAIHTGTNATNRLQVIAKGQTMTFLVNSVAVDQATLSTFATGTVGLRGISDGKVVFQQLSISSV